jgi:hypothetical protein
VISLSTLEGEVLAWAEDNHPTAYAQTLGVRSRKGTYRRYLQRLVEIRYEQDDQWDPPMRLLEDTNIEAKFKTADGNEFEVKGRRCKGLRRMSWDFMATIVEQDMPTEALSVAIRELDLFVPDTDRPHDWVIPDEPPDISDETQVAEAPTEPTCTRCNKRPIQGRGYTCAECANNSQSKQESLGI